MFLVLLTMLQCCHAKLHEVEHYIITYRVVISTFVWWDIHVLYIFFYTLWIDEWLDESYMEETRSVDEVITSRQFCRNFVDIYMYMIFIYMHVHVPKVAFRVSVSRPEIPSSATTRPVLESGTTEWLDESYTEETRSVDELTTSSSVMSYLEMINNRNNKCCLNFDIIVELRLFLKC